jgi:hypothetical protein
LEPIVSTGTIPAGLDTRTTALVLNCYPGWVTPDQPACATTTQMVWEVENIEAAVRELRGRGVLFEDDDPPGPATMGGIADLEKNFPSKGTGVRVAWFRDSEGNMLSMGEPVGEGTEARSTPATGGQRQPRDAVEQRTLTR